MAEDQLAQLVHRTMNDTVFAQRALADLEGTLAAEGIQLTAEELGAVKEFHAQFAQSTPEQVQSGLASALASTARRQHGG